MHPSRRALLIAVASAASVLSLAACAAKDDKTAPAETRAGNLTLPAAQRAKIRVEKIEASHFRRTLETTGTVAFDADQATQVLSPISGPVARLLVNVGTAVKQAEPLASISSPDFGVAVGAYRKAEVAAAKPPAHRRSGRAALPERRPRAPGDGTGRSRRRLGRSRSRGALEQLHALGVDEATIEEIREGRQAAGPRGAIRSPIDGRVVEKLITPGQLLQAGPTQCFTVADLSTVWVMANVFEVRPSLRRDRRPGGRSRPGGTPDVLPGRVDYIAAMVDPNTRAVRGPHRRPEPAGVLKQDMYVRVALHSRRDSDGLLAPASAVLRDDENLPFVFVANADGTFARRRVEIGSQVGDRIEIRSGSRRGSRWSRGRPLHAVRGEPVSPPRPPPRRKATGGVGHQPHRLVVPAPAVPRRAPARSCSGRGVWSLSRLPVDAYPDLSPPMVEIDHAMARPRRRGGRAADHRADRGRDERPAEDDGSPLDLALRALRRAHDVRAGTDNYFARQRVFERLPRRPCPTA